MTLLQILLNLIAGAAIAIAIAILFYLAHRDGHLNRRQRLWRQVADGFAALAQLCANGDPPSPPTDIADELGLADDTILDQLRRLADDAFNASDGEAR